MPHPSSSLAVLRPELAGSLEEFNLANDRNGFIGAQVLPVFEVAKASGTFGRIPVEQLLQQPETVRAPGSAYNRGKFSFTTDTFATIEHGWEEPIDDAEAAMYADFFNAEQISAARAYDIVLRAQEIRTAAAIFNSTTWTGATLTTAAAVTWTQANHATSVPITDVNSAKVKVWNGCGLWPNALIMSYAKFMALRTIDQVVDAITSAGAGQSRRASEITRELLASVFDVDYILVAGASKNTAKEGQATVFANIWSDSYCSVARLCTSQDIREPGLGRTFHWGSDGSQIGGTIETYRDETIRGDVVRVRNQVHEKVLYTECAHLISGCS